MSTQRLIVASDSQSRALVMLSGERPARSEGRLQSKHPYPLLGRGPRRSSRASGETRRNQTAVVAIGMLRLRSGDRAAISTARSAWQGRWPRD